MAGSSSNQEIFDVRKIRRLVELMHEHDLSEMDLRQGDTRIQLRRTMDLPPAAPAVPVVVSGPAAVGAKAEGAAGGPSSEESAVEEHVGWIKSPMVGTFYGSPDPDAASYVKVGDSVGPDSTVCIVEAMKVFNEIQAEISGKILAVLAENGEPVEFGQNLFKVDTRR